MDKKTSLPQKISLILFGLFLTIVILEIILRIGGFTILFLQEHRNLQSIKQKGACRIMCLGESTTQNQWPPYLEKILNQRNVGIKFNVIDKGLGSTTTTVILSELEANLDKYQPDMVVTMMGINDGGSHMPYEATSTSKIILTLRSFKVYKLTRLLWLHMVTKFKEKGFYKSMSNNQTVRSLSSHVPRYSSREMHKQQGFFQQEQAFKKAIELDPKNDSGYTRLGGFYRTQWKFVEAEQAFKKAIELNSKNDSAYIELGWIYRIQEKFTESEQAFKKAIELNSKNDSGYIELGWIYINQGKLTESEQMLKHVLDHNPNNDFAIGGLATIYREIGNNELSEVYAKKADSLRDEYSNPKTINNYRTLKQILDKRKIKLVCMQYPVRNIAPLKKIFREEPEGNIIFVDNEKIFKDAIRKEGYKEYFKDMFGGDFGHCTDKGNKLLAENIANTILKEIFHK